MLSWILDVRKHEIESTAENEQISSVKRQSMQKSDKKTLKFWTFVARDNDSYESSLRSSDEMMILICLNKNDQRRSKTWLRFDVDANDIKVIIFADSDVIHCFIVKRFVDLLELKLQLFSDKMRLKSDKSVDVMSFTKFKWSKNEFHIETECIILNMKNDLILNENFWQKYRLFFDYDIMKIKIRAEEIEFTFNDIENRSRLQIFENQSFAIDEINRRIFERFIRKKTKIFLYVVRKVDEDIVVDVFIELISLQRFNDHSELNKALSFDNLKIFKSDLFDESSSKRPQNHNIDIDDARSINKSSYSLFKEQNDELVI